MPDWIARGWHEYARRMPPGIDLELVEVPQPRGAGGDERLREGRALLKRCSTPGLRVALDEHGSAWTTRDVAQGLDRWMSDGQDVWLLVGGAAGHSAEVLDQCPLRWSLGPLTFPHMLVRVIVAEQLYRAWTVLSGHPYHRG